jgi:hypothetical protein
LWLASVLASASAAPVTVGSHVTYQVPEGIYVDAGGNQGLQQGLQGTLRLDDGRVFQFEVLYVASKSSLLRLTSPPDGQEGLVGRSADVTFDSLPPGAGRTGADANSPRPPGGQAPGTLPDRDFVPLLAPVKVPAGPPMTQDVFHGRVQLRRMMQTDSQGHDYSRTLLDSSGDLDRMAGSGWSFQWSGALSYRDGAAMQSSPDYQDVRPDLYRASLQHPWMGAGFVRAGRFLPHELPAIGYVDGVQGEIPGSDHLHFGAVAGLRPDRQDMAATAREPLASAYTTLEAGHRDGPSYSGTLGLLSSLYEGRTDRLSVLFDQKASLGPKLAAYSTAEVDLDVGNAQVRTGTRLTRLDTFIVSRLSRVLTVRAGLDHWERPDRPSERALLPVADDRLFDEGYWRYWVGGQQDLPWSLHLSEEVGLISGSEADSTPRWQIGLTRIGLLDWAQASSTVTLYNLEGAGASGYGARLSSFLPMFDGQIIIQPEAGIRLLTPEAESDNLSLTYAALRLDGRISRSWTLSGGFTYTTFEGETSTLLDLGLRITW